jgi:putative spermidine/putrescine transport system permease protein
VLDLSAVSTTGRGFVAASLFVIPLAYLVLLFLVPISKMAALSVWNSGLTIAYYRQIFGTDVYLNSLYWTFKLALVTSALCLALGYPVALAMAKASPRMRAAMLVCIILPFWTSSLVRAFSWISILGRKGLVNSLLVSAGLIDAPLRLAFTPLAVYIGTVHIMLPYMVLALYSTMIGIDRSGIRAARSLGASPIRALLLIYIPQTMPGIVSGLLLVFIITLGFFITPSVLGGTEVRPFVVLVERYMNQLLNWPLASALSVVLLVPTLGLYFGFRQLIDPHGGAHRPGVGMVLAFRAFARIDSLTRPIRKLARSLPRIMPHRAETERPAIAMVIALLIIGVIVLPILLIVMQAFTTSDIGALSIDNLSLQWFEMYFTREEWVEATVNSLEIAAVVAVISCVLATPIALGLRREPRKFGSLVLGMSIMPMIVPAVVYGVAIYLLFAGIGLVGTKTGLILAHAVLALPLALLLIHNAVQGLDQRIEDAAASLGAGSWWTFRQVTLLLILPAVGSAALLAFLTSFDDLGVALFLTSGESMTLPRKIFESLRVESDPRATAASALLVGISLIAMVAFQLLRRWTVEISSTRLSSLGE